MDIMNYSPQTFLAEPGMTFVWRFCYYRS